MLEKGRLAFDDFTSDRQDCFLSLIDCLDDHSSITNIIAEVISGLAISCGIGKEVLVFVVDAKTGKIASGERGLVFSKSQLGNDYIRLDVGVSSGDETGAR